MEYLLGRRKFFGEQRSIHRRSALLLPGFRAAVAVFMLIVSLGFPQAGSAQITLVFGTYAAEKPTETVRSLSPIIKYLEAGLSEMLEEEVRITMQLTSKHNDSADDVILGEVDFARVGPASYVTVKNADQDVEILVVEAVNGQRLFNGVIAVHRDSDIQTLADLTGRSFAFGSELSAVGPILAQSLLFDAGFTAETLGNYEFIGHHDWVGAAVGSGEYDAGALAEGAFDTLVAANVPLRAISRFDNVTRPWIMRSNLDLKMRSALRKLMLQVDDPEMFAALQVSGFLVGEDADYDVIRAAIAKSHEFGD